MCILSYRPELSSDLSLLTQGGEIRTPLSDQHDPCPLQDLRRRGAYNSHRESAHFKKYVETTKDVIKSRKLIETVPVQLSDKKK